MKPILCTSVLLAAFWVGGCASAPREGGGAASLAELGKSDAEVISTLRAKSARLSSLTAVIGMSYRDDKRDGSFEAIFLYRAPRQLRLQAYKDLVVHDKQLIDLLLSPLGYAIKHDLDATPVDDRGARADFPKAHPGFAGMSWTGEALFLPGAADAEAPIEILARRPGAIRVATTLYSGARAEWDLDPVTLRVSRGFVSAPPLRVQLDYSDYQGAGGALDLPNEVRFRSGDIELRVQLRELDLEPEFTPSAFRLPGPP